MIEETVKSVLEAEEKVKTQQSEAKEKAAALIEEAKAFAKTALTEADVAFHDTIYSGTGNRRLIQILENLREQMYRFRFEYMKDASIRESLISEHEEIMRAVAARDSELAAELIGDHIDNQQKVIHAGIASMEGEI